MTILVPAHTFPFTSLELAICVPLGSTVKLTKTKAVNSLSAFRVSSGESVFFHDQVMSQVDDDPGARSLGCCG